MQLAAHLAEGRLPHALLLAGPAGTGKRVFARAFGQALLCERRAPDARSCGACPSCRLVAAGSHPDLHLVRPALIALAEGMSDQEEGDAEPDEDADAGAGATAKARVSREITVDQIRKLGDAVTLATHRGGMRVVIVYPAEAMNAIASNALLKTLEEPVPGVVFLLVSDAPHRLLPTIVSRCRRLPMPVPERALALDWLNGQGAAGEERLALVGGAPVRAAELAQSPYWDVHASLVRGLAQGADIDALTLARSLDTELKRQDREAQLGRPRNVDLAVVVSWLQRWVHDGLRMRLTQTIGYHRSAGEGIARLAAVPTARLFAYRAWLVDAARQAGHPVNQLLFLEDSLLRYRALFNQRGEAAGQ